MVKHKLKPSVLSCHASGSDMTASLVDLLLCTFRQTVRRRHSVKTYTKRVLKSSNPRVMRDQPAASWTIRAHNFLRQVIMAFGTL